MQSRYDDLLRRCEYLEKQLQEQGRNFVMNADNMQNQTHSSINESYDENKSGIEETGTTPATKYNSSEESNVKQQPKQITICGDPENIAIQYSSETYTTKAGLTL
ncbi:hypothetical protein DPMN_113307 [Dreissena polymorpha]|uniref:Uncharacterized protein n=1 Tax=Dreissena polymorpha TaxID=45954 RepID=A0A9D4KI67_DREPO|nr:hypothetical protein DPMN_113307 [Dreissena polymorpha]